MRNHARSVTARAWILVAVPLGITLLGLGMSRFDVFSEYRGYVGNETVPEVLIRSGRTGRQLRLLDYMPLAGIKLEDFDVNLDPSEMPSTTIIEPETFESSRAIISVVIDSEYLLSREFGLMANFNERGRSWERPAYVSFFRDGRPVWAVGAGLRVHGGKSRSMNEKSFRLHFRELYGTPALSRNLVFSGADSPMSSLVIHNDRRFTEREGVRTAWHYINPMAYEIAAQIGGITVATYPVDFYLNGEYQGPYVLKERVRPDFLMARFGHDDFFLSDTKSDDGSSPLIQGSQEELRELEEWLGEAPIPLRMADVEQAFDIGNLTNWFISILYCATTDPFQGAVARDKSQPDSKWFWVNWDMDHSFMDFYNQVEYPWQLDNFAGRSGIIGDRRLRPALFNRLRTESPAYREYFLARMVEVLNHELTIEFMNGLISRYEGTAEAFDIEDRSYFETLRLFAKHRPEVLRSQMNAYFSAGPSYQLTVNAPVGLGVTVNGREIGTAYVGHYFADTPATIRIGDETLAGQVAWFVNGVPLNRDERDLDIRFESNMVVDILLEDDS